jgi:hypothetical protein
LVKLSQKVRRNQERVLLRGLAVCYDAHHLSAPAEHIRSEDNESGQEDVEDN